VEVAGRGRRGIRSERERAVNFAGIDAPAGAHPGVDRRGRGEVRVSVADIPLRGRISSAARFPRRFFIRDGKIARCHAATALVRHDPHEPLTDKPPLGVRCGNPLRGQILRKKQLG